MLEHRRGGYYSSGRFRGRSCHFVFFLFSLMSWPAITDVVSHCDRDTVLTKTPPATTEAPKSSINSSNRPTSGYTHMRTAGAQKLTLTDEDYGRKGSTTAYGERFDYGPTWCRRNCADSTPLVGVFPPQHLQGKLQCSIPIDFGLFTSRESPQCPHPRLLGLLFSHAWA